jgi:regulatory protein YycI of two-component signal transduction system YycFG
LLTWWIYFLIFDIWLEVILPNKQVTDNTIKTEEKENETHNQ